jgi:hypothetical protein
VDLPRGQRDHHRRGLRRLTWEHDLYIHWSIIGSSWAESRA